jgi:hypothetical protein
MGRVMTAVVLSAFCALVVAVPSAWAYWVQDGVALCTAAGFQGSPQITSDGVGGVIVVWNDGRDGTNGIYVQRLDISGAVQWAADGIELCTGTVDSPQITSDGAGGAIVTWMDGRNGIGDIYAQRVNASGAVQWAEDGVALCAAGQGQYYPHIASDGAGGAIVAWCDYRSGTGGLGTADIYAQRVNASGAVQWMADGVALCTAGGDQAEPQITSDDAGGAIVTWHDRRGGYSDIYAQRVNALGAVQWMADGVALSTANGDQANPQMTSDGAGGAIVTWWDYRNADKDIYAQRVNASGSVQWPTDGVALCTATGAQQFPAILSDGAGGAIVAWYDLRSPASGYDIYAQRVNALGAVQWVADGVALCTANGIQVSPEMASDDAGGAIVAWCDYRSGTGDIYAQRVNASGAVQWTTDGASVCTAAWNQTSPMIASDGVGGAIVTWSDRRGEDSDIYAQRVCQGVAPVATLLASFSARVEESVVRVGWELSEPAAGLTFDVLRSSAGPGAFEEIPVAIESNGKAFSFADAQCKPGSIVRYRVDVTESGARRTLFETDAVAVPTEPLALFQNSPNPFNPTTTLRYYLPAPCEVTLSIYDASGRLVATLVDRERQDAGQRVGIWSGLDSRGGAVPSGVYFSVLTAGKERVSNKMILLR